MKRNIKFIQTRLANGEYFVFNAFSIVSISRGEAPQSIKIIFTNNTYIECNSPLGIKGFTAEVLKAINDPTGHSDIYQSA